MTTMMKVLTSAKKFPMMKYLESHDIYMRKAAALKAKVNMQAKEWEELEILI